MKPGLLLGRHGFTFIGLILVITTLALITAALYLAIPPSESVRQSQATMVQASLIEAAIKKYKLGNAGLAPATLSNLVTTTGAPCTVVTNSSSSNYRNLVGWCGPYLDQPIASSPNAYQTDGWGVLFRYDGVTLKSCGPDRTCGNSDDLTFTNF